jgi:hypothetical protein
MKKAEDRIQQEIVQWFNNTYPSLRGLLCYNLNNSQNAIDGNRNKMKGLIAGRSDLVLYYCGEAYMIELKTLKGRQGDEQKAWQKLIESHGFEYFIIRDLKEFQQLVTEKIIYHF